jgi:hypothetical protein
MSRARVRRKIWFGRARALFWAVLGLASFPLGWSSSVVLVWIASVYANVESSIASSEAADDRELVARLQRIERTQEAILRFLMKGNIVSDVTAKVKCTNKVEQNGGVSLSFFANYKDADGNLVNQEWAAFTPHLSVSMTVKPGSDAADAFEHGKTYTLTFSPEETPEPAEAAVEGSEDDEETQASQSGDTAA